MAATALATGLQAGRDYPANEAEFRAWFPDDAACRDFLEWLRWPDGFECPTCDGAPGEAYQLADYTWWCPTCDVRTSVTAGTVFHRTRTPLTVWFAAAWYVTGTKAGVSAKTLQQLLGFGSYQTAWAMLHRFRSAMVRPGRDRLTGTVEVDESFIGGVKPGKRGRGAAGKIMVAIAVEQLSPKGFGRARVQVVPDARIVTLRQFLLDNIEPGSVVITDGLASYRKACGTDYTHKPFVVAGSGVQANVPLPGVHRVASLVKRWLLGTHQGSVEGDHLQAYLDEWTFRFNRRRSRNRGLLFRRLLEQAVTTDPTTYRELIVRPRPMSAEQWKKLKLPPPDKKVAPESLAIQVRDRPWRR